MIDLLFSLDPSFLFELPELLAQAGGGGNFGGGGGGGGGFGGGGGGFGGGGGGFGGGGFGGGGYSGSGGGGGGGLLALPATCSVPLIIVIVIIIVIAQQKERSVRIRRTIRKGRKVQEEMMRSDALSRIKQADPDFDVATFLQRTANAFVTTQYAWSDQNLNACRAFISDGVHERFDLYIAMQKAENIRNRMKNVQILSQQIVCVTSDPGFDTIHVRVVASAISYNESLTTGKCESGSNTVPLQFTEIWSFSRRPGVKTNTKASLLDGNCPNCGGPVAIVDRAQCPQCDSIVNSGKFDWVLAEITQDEEWVVPPASHHVPGWQEVSAADPGLNFQHIEDRASCIYWRCMMAVYFQDFGYAFPILDQNLKQVPRRWYLGENGFWKTPAVGVVEIIRATPAMNDEFDRIHVRIRWSATRAEGDRKHPRLLDHQRIYSHVLVLKRSKNVKSKIDFTFASSSCYNCGAPINVGKSGTCEFCSTELNDGKLDWILESVESYDAVKEAYFDDVHRLERERFSNEPELLAAMVKMVMSDGQLDDRERRFITNMARSRGVGPEKLELILATAASDSEAIQMPKNEDQWRYFMDQLIRASLIDGRITRHEQQILLNVCKELNWSHADLKYAVARIRKELLQQSRAILGQAKRRRKNNERFFDD